MLLKPEVRNATGAAWDVGLANTPCSMLTIIQLRRTKCVRRRFFEYLCSISCAYELGTMTWVARAFFMSSIKIPPVPRNAIRRYRCTSALTLLGNPWIEIRQPSKHRDVDDSIKPWCSVWHCFFLFCTNFSSVVMNAVICASSEAVPAAVNSSKLPLLVVASIMMALGSTVFDF